jgi:uncharacterized membrane-anchored protein
MTTQNKNILKIAIVVILLLCWALPTAIYRFKHPEKTGTQIFLHTFKTIQWDLK